MEWKLYFFLITLQLLKKISRFRIPELNERFTCSRFNSQIACCLFSV